MYEIFFDNEQQSIIITCEISQRNKHFGPIARTKVLDTRHAWLVNTTTLRVTSTTLRLIMGVSVPGIQDLEVEHSIKSSMRLRVQE